MIRALLVDDEEPARARLRRLLTEAGGVDVVGEAADGGQAVEQIVRLAPALVFLDIQMPGSSGLEVAASLPAPRPHVVFCTAFDEYAVDAFELNAVDYLLKPVSRARLDKALERVRARAANAERDDGLDRMTRSGGGPGRFLVRKGQAYRVVAAREVSCILSDGGLTQLHAGGEHYWMPPTLNDLEARLDERRFFRISRAAIVNLDAVRELVPIAGGSGELTLKDGTRLEVSRRRFRDLADRLGGL
jgi:two-component system LytT family response regulator